MKDQDIKTVVERGLKQTVKGFVFSQQQKVLDQQTASVDFSSLLSEQIETSIYIQDTNTDFKVIMCSPYIEYNIPGYNFTFVKQLNRLEIRDFVDGHFKDWENQCLALLNSVKKFKDALREVNQATQTKQEEVTICHFSDNVG